MVDVAVVDPLPLFCAGVAAALAAAHVVEQPLDVLTWLHGRPTAVLIISLGSESDWSLLGAISSNYCNVAVVALTVDTNSAAGVRAVRAGACSVLRRAVRPELLRQAVDAAADGISLLPADVLRAMSGGETPGRQPKSRLVSEEQISWLRALASGSTVTDLAARSGYSERAMYRLLRDLYDQFGVRGRTEALMRAQSAGLISL